MARTLASTALVLSLLLVCAPAPADAFWWLFNREAPVNGTAEFLNLVDFLSKNNYTTLVTALVDTSLAPALNETLVAENKLTILAPTDAAFAAFSPTPSCNISLTTTLLLHVLPAYIPGALVQYSPVGVQIHTKTAVPMTKVGQLPLAVGTATGDGNILSAAAITLPDHYSTSQVVVHGIDKVVNYPC